MSNNSFPEIIAALEEARRLLILGHVGPDADCYGSTCALFLALKQQGKNVTLVNASGKVEAYSFIPGWEHVQETFPSEAADLVVALDCGERKRVGDELLEGLSQAPKLINIDHHVSNDYFGDLNFVDPEVSSTSELVYDLLCEMKCDVSPDIALALLVGIVGDTGSFRYSSTSPKTLGVAKELMEYGADLHYAAVQLYGRKSLGVLRLESEAISNLTLYCDERLAEVVIPKEMCERHRVRPEAAENLVERLRDIDGVMVAVVLREQDDLWRVSLRSQSGEYDVSQVAERFGGGGHRAAAAFRWRQSLEVLRQSLLPELQALFHGAQ